MGFFFFSLIDASITICTYILVYLHTPDQYEVMYGIK